METGNSSRQTSDSLCARPAGRPRELHFYVAGSACATDVYQEVVDAAWAEKRATAYTAAAFVGDVLARLKQAARGELRSAEDLVPVRRDPLLWEIRWHRGVSRDHRMYHAEPGVTGERPALVALRFHRKALDGGEAAVTAAQDAEIDLAGGRYAEGVGRRWGHGPNPEISRGDRGVNDEGAPELG